MLSIDHNFLSRSNHNSTVLSTKINMYIICDIIFLSIICMKEWGSTTKSMLSFSCSNHVVLLAGSGLLRVKLLDGKYCYRLLIPKILLVQCTSSPAVCHIIHIDL